MATIKDLEDRSKQVETETRFKRNTAFRIGNLFYDIIQFFKGLLGGSISLDEPMADEAAIKAIQNPYTNETHQALDTGDYWRYNGTTWVNIGKIIPANALTRDDLQTVVNDSENPVSSNAVNNKVKDLPQAYNPIELTTQIGFYEWNTGNFRAAAGWLSAELDLSATGREIYVTGMMNNNGTCLAVYMNGNTYLGYEFRGDGSIIKYEKQLLTVPQAATRVLLTANNSVNSTSPVLGAYTLDIAKDILTSDTAKKEFTTNKDFIEVTNTIPSKFEKQDLIKENGFVAPNGGLTSTTADYQRAKFIITDENRDSIYYTGIQTIKGAVIAAYFNELGAFISSEPETDGTFTPYDRRKLSPPEDAAYMWACGRKSGTGSRAINSYNFFIELKKTDNSLLNKAVDTTVKETTNAINKIAELKNAYVLDQTYVKRWFRNWMRIQNDKTIINAVAVPVIRDYIGNKYFTGDIKVSVVTSTGFKYVETIPFEKVNHYNSIDKATADLSDFDYIVYLKDYLFLDKGDWIQITSYCVNPDDKLALAVRYKQDNEPESELYSVADNGFYQGDGDTVLSDSDMINLFTVQSNTAWCSYCAIGLMTANISKNIEVLMPKRIYTVCNDNGVTGDAVRSNRHYSAILQLDHCLHNLKSEPKDLRILNNGRDRLLFYAPIESKAFGDVPTYNKDEDVLKQNVAVTIGGGAYNEQRFNVEHISVKNSITKTQKPSVLAIGDSTLVAEGDPLNGYPLLCKQLYKMDWIDNGKVDGEFDIQFLGHAKRSKTFGYKGENISIDIFYEGVTGASSTDNNIFFDTASGKYTLKNWLAKYRTMDDNGNRLAADSPDRGSDVTNVNAYDVFVPQNIIFGLGANDPIAFDWLGNVKKFITDIKAEYAAENWGTVNIAIIHPDSAGTYFPSLHPELSDDMYYWNTDTEGRHSQFWKFANDWLNDNTYDEDTDRVFYVPFMFTSPCDVAKNRPVTLPDGEPIHVPFGWGPTTHVYAKAYWHWAYQIYAWLKYATSL